MSLRNLLGLMGKEVIAFIGAGGKTTLMNCLAWELASQGKVVLTTTTRIYCPKWSVEEVVMAANLEDALRLVKTSLDDHRLIALGTGIIEGNKLNGIPIDWISSLKELSPAEWILVEADGAAGKPLKGHRHWEPVLSEAIHVVIAVTGIDVIGKPLRGDWVHRPEVVQDLTGLALGDPVSINAASDVMEYTLKLAMELAPSARLFPWINKIDNKELLGLGRRLARLIYQHSGKKVVLGKAEHKSEYSVIQVWPPDFQVGAVVLAAGMSTRLPSGKCLLPIGNQTVLERVVENVLASNANPLVVVLGYNHHQLLPLITNYQVNVVINHDYHLGLAASLQRGLMELPESSGVLFCLADQPLVLPEVMDQLIESFSFSPVAVVYPEYQGRRGNPTLFGRDVFPEFLKLKGDEGGRRLIKDMPKAHVRALPVCDPGVLQDIDFFDDYLLVLKAMKDK